MSEQLGSQTVDTQIETPETPETPSVDEKKEAIDAFREAFGLSSETEEPSTEEKETEETPAPAKEPETSAETSKKLTVKFNKEDIEVDEAQIPELVQKGLALEKERERRSKDEQLLKEAATLLGLDSLDEATIQRMKQEREERSKNEFDQLKQDIINELVLNGITEEDARAYAERNPLVLKAQQKLQEDEIRTEQEQKNRQAEEWKAKWDALYAAYPDLKESAKTFTEGGRPEWYTVEMESRIQRGYDPIDAYQLAHMNTIKSQTEKQAEQKAIKQQMLAKRSQVETTTSPDAEPEVPEALASAFDLFGLSRKSAKKYVKKA